MSGEEDKVSRLMTGPHVSSTEQHDPKLDAAQQPDTESKTLADRILGVDDVFALKPPEALIDGLVFHGEACQLTGKPGSGKSIVALGWALAVAAELRSWEGHRITNPGPVVYVAAEGASGLAARIGAWCQLNNVPIDNLNGRFFVLPVAAQLAKAEHVAEVVHMVRERAAVLVVLDTRARMTLGLDENSAKDQGPAIAAVDVIQRETNAAVLLVHHSARNGDGAGRGSNTWDAALFSDLRLKRVGEKRDLRIELECSKHKDAPDGCKHNYRLKVVTVPDHVMPGRTEAQRQSLVAVATDERVQGSNTGLTDWDKRVLDVVQECAGQEGISRSEIKRLLGVDAQMRGTAEEQAVYRSVKRLSEKLKMIRAEGTGKSIRYFSPDTEALMGGDVDS